MKNIGMAFGSGASLAQKLSAPSSANTDNTFSVPTESASRDPKKQQELKSKSTVTHAQYLRIFSELAGGEKSTIALRRSGVMQPAARTKEMRERLGISIHRTRLQNIFDEQGYLHPRVAFYGIDDLEDAKQKLSGEVKL